LSRPKVIQRGIRLALAEALSQPKPLPQNVHKAEAKVEEFEVKTLVRGGSTWFEMDQTLALLGVAEEALMEKVDREDDVLQYAGARWVETRSLTEAATLCSDKGLSARVRAWAERK
jgi:hypothetical protein